MMCDRIEKKLREGLSPDYIEVVDESHQHSVPVGSESHFKVVISAEAFDGIRLIARHRMIYQLLQAELDQHIHALALHTYTPTEWDELKNDAPDSPACRGGSRLA
ncbi:transcriptional regulator BolA [Budvicia diplopodorum]|uniref:transcriptional regulator BolA n=1 Tax=Budvicia diplopodorum TaxID=1119056 RepID=UPI001359E445|nr:transcriptional regulator BolA [Budvicia diplopodorum]